MLIMTEASIGAERKSYEQQSTAETASILLSLSWQLKRGASI